MLCSRGKNLTHHIKQMILLTAVASAAVISASFLIPNSVEARNGWIFSHQSEKTGSVYYKPTGCKDKICNAMVKVGGQEPFTWAVNCNSWQQYTIYPERAWADLMPGSHGETWAKSVCR